jgi:hypothetical protein
MRSISVHYKFDLLRNLALVSLEAQGRWIVEDLGRLPLTPTFLITLTVVVRVISS